MYKLTVISGPNRGTSYAVQEGELSIGRQTGNTIVLQSSKVSKTHCVLLVKNGEVVIKDQGSSNGTFINGTLTKLKKLKTGDRISVGEYVFELVAPSQRSPKAAPVTNAFGNSFQIPGVKPINSMPGMNSITAPANQPPKDLKEKVIWAFEHQLMPIFYGLNTKNQWKMICIGIFAVYLIANLIISIYPLMESNRTDVIKEIGRRASFMARQIAERNSPYIAAHAETKTDLGMIENAEGVRIAVLIDLENRIIAPSAKMNQYLSSGDEAVWATKARDMFRAGRETGFVRETDSTTLVAIEPVKILSPTLGKNVVVGMALVSIDTGLATPDLGGMGVIYSEALIMTGVLGLILLFILYRITLKPFEVLNEDLDKALKGEITQVSREFKFEEMNPLWDIINSAIQRIPKSDTNLNGNLGGMADLSRWVEDCISPLRMLGGIIKFGLVIFDSEQKIVYLNSAFEEISGIREEGAIGRQMSDVARDQAMGVFTNDILSRAPMSGEGVSEDFDFSGTSYKMYAAAFGQMGHPTKGFILASIRVEP